MLLNLIVTAVGADPVPSDIIHTLISIAPDLSVSAALIIAIYAFFTGKIITPKTVEQVKEGYTDVIEGKDEIIDLLKEEVDKKDRVIESKDNQITLQHQAIRSFSEKMLEALPEAKRLNDGGHYNG